MARWVLWVRDASRELVAQIDDFSSAAFSIPFNDVGGWLVTGIPMESRAGAALGPGSGIVAVRDDEVEFTGPLLFPSVRWDKDGWVIDASGSSDDLALWGRITFPAAPSLDLNAAYSDDRSGTASTVMRQYVDVNAGPGADVTRRWAGLTLAADPAIGSAVSFSARNESLGDVLAQLAIVGGDIGFRVAQELDGSDLEFSVYEPEDVSGSAIFQPGLGNLAAYTYSAKAPTVTRTIVGGQGEGTLRTFVERSDPVAEALWGMRLESFVDQRNTSVTDELEQAGDEELADNGAQTSIELEPVDTDAVSYGVHYRVGSLVTVRTLEGVEVIDRVRQVEIALGPNGETITPTVGTPGAREASASDDAAVALLLDRITRLSRRLSRLTAST